jgi:hypothetical protein
MLIVGAGNGDRADPSQCCELEDVAADGTRRAGDEQRVARFDAAQAQGAVGGQPVERQGCRLDQAGAPGRRGQRAFVEHDLVGLCARDRGEDVAQTDDLVADGEARHARADRSHGAGDVTAECGLGRRDQEAGLGERARARGQVDRIDGSFMAPCGRTAPCRPSCRRRSARPRR